MLADACMHGHGSNARGRDTRVLGGGELGEERVLALDVRKNNVCGLDAIEPRPPQALEARHESRDVQSENARVRTCAGGTMHGQRPAARTMYVCARAHTER